MKYLFTFILTFIIISARAQNRNELWSKISVTKPVTPKIDVAADVQHRRQNGLGVNDTDMFQYGLTNSLRLWAYYKPKQNWTIIVSPLAYFQNTIIKSPAKSFLRLDELRTSVGGSNVFEWKMIKNKNRILYEIASVQPFSSNVFIRHRYRLQNSFTVSLSKIDHGSHINFNTTNEILIRTQKHNTEFDQNRFYNGLQWKMPVTELNIGYQWTVQKTKSNEIFKDQFLVTANFFLK